jgi:hypothetical protein
MSDDDDGTALLWVGLALAVVFFLSKKFSPAVAASAPPLPALPAPPSTSSAVTPPATPDLTAAATNASAPAFASDTDFGIQTSEEW